MKDENQMNYSVLMSVYAKEQPEYLRMSIESMLNQTYPTNDFVLVCDGELTEELYRVINHYRDRCLEIFHVIQLEQNVGLAKALNTGLPECKNDIVARMDSDDVSYPYRCEMQMEILQKQDYDIVGGNVDEFLETPDKIMSRRVVPCTHREIVRYSRKRNPFNHPTVMYRKKKVLAVGGYMNFPLFEDYYLWVKMIQSGSKTYNIQKSLVCMRTGAGMYNRRGGLAYIEYLFKFRFALLKEQYINGIEFLVFSIGHTFVCLMPNWLRRLIYEKLLRKR